MTFAAQAFPPLELSSTFFLTNSYFSLQVSTCTHWQWSIDIMEAFSPPVELHSAPTLHSRRHPPPYPLFRIFPFVMQDIERGLHTSCSESQHPVIVTEQPVTGRALSGAGSLAQKVQGKLLGVSQELYKGFRRPRLLKEPPNFKPSLHEAFHRSCESLPAGFLCSITIS
jgi:hypothetical protein